MKTAYQLELSVMRDRLWIHSTADGSTVGRFGRMGIDLHNTMTEQMAGKPQCRLCTHQRPTVADWLCSENVPKNGGESRCLVMLLTKPCCYPPLAPNLMTQLQVASNERVVDSSCANAKERG